MPIYIILGTRAQIIKMAPMMALLEEKNIEYSLLNTMQHTEKMEDLLVDFGIKTPLKNIFEVKNEAKTIKLFGAWLVKIGLITINPFSRKKIFSKGRGLVLTHGDTVTTAWAAIYAKMSFCKVMHVEAGLRSHNLRQPFPEELMRRITGLFSNYHICPDEVAVKNLKRYPGKKINAGANTMYDGIAYAKKLIRKDPSTMDLLKSRFSLPSKFVVASIHRYENIFDKNMLEKVLKIIESVSDKFEIVFILHPSTRLQLEDTNNYQRLKDNPKIHLISRLNFIEFVALTELSEFLLTDSGGNQQEMSYTGKPTLLIRDVVEGQEGIGKNILISHYDMDIVEDFVRNYKKYQKEFVKLKSPSEIAVKLITQIIQG